MMGRFISLPDVKSLEIAEFDTANHEVSLVTKGFDSQNHFETPVSYLI